MMFLAEAVLAGKLSRIIQNNLKSMIQPHQFNQSKELAEFYEHYFSKDDFHYYNLCAHWKARNIISICHDIKPQTVIEIGGGLGAILQQLSDQEFGKKLYSAEVADSHIEAIKSRNISKLVDVQKFDGYNLSYADKQFDLAILSHVLEHVEYPRKLLAELKRIARYVFIEVPLENTLFEKKDYVPDAVGHINFYNPITVRKLVQTCGLEVITQVTRNSSYETFCYHNKVVGPIKYFVKQTCLNLLPRIAPLLFTYQSALLCTSKDV
jgi:SAM-dependent methyltransferase